MAIVSRIFINMKRKSTIVVNAAIITILLGVMVTVLTLNLNPPQPAGAPTTSGDRTRNQVTLMFAATESSPFLADIATILHLTHTPATLVISRDFARTNMAQLDSLAHRFEFANHGGATPMAGTPLTHQRNQIQATRQLINAVTGKTTDMFIPPNLAYCTLTLRAAESLGYTTILPTRTSFQDVQAGDIILLRPTSQTAATLVADLTALQQQGLHVVALSEILL